MTKLTEKQKRQICENSIERVMNNAIWLAQHLVNHPKAEVSERAGIFLDDAENLKIIMSLIWNDARNEIFKETP